MSIALAALLLAACDPRPLGDDLRAEISTPLPVSVDLGCAGCAESVTVEVYFDPDAYLTEEDEVVLQQFRVDYDLEGVRGEVPYFAGVIEQYVRARDDASFTVQVAGRAQREHLRGEEPDEDLRGRATVTLAGYDSNDEQVMLEVDFPITFAAGGAAAEAP